ncbi:MAG: ATP-binding protein, partial [Pirellulales bacterium]|nr:ATP-binding protein [Pirellulales bacterium]
DRLVGLCTRMLTRDPQGRPDAFEIVSVISKNDVSAPLLSDGKREVLVGRTTQLNALEQEATKLNAASQHLGGAGSRTVFVSGRSGEGKSALVNHFLEPLRSSGRTTVLSGRCYDRESVPFKAFPEMLRAEVVANKAETVRTGDLDEQQIRQRAFDALRTLLDRMGGARAHCDVYRRSAVGRRRQRTSDV